MATTSIPYLFEQIEAENWRFYKIFNASGQLMKDQINEDFSQEDVFNDLKRFFEHNDGTFRIEFRSTKTATQKGRKISYTVRNSASSAGIGSISSPMLGDTSGLYISWIQSLQAQNLQLMQQLNAQTIGALNDSHSKDIEILKRDLKPKDDNSSAMIQQTIAAVSQMFSGRTVGVAGIGEDYEQADAYDQNPNMSEEDKKINKAVVSLKANDPEFADHIALLAKLCRDNNQMYMTLANQLSGLVGN